MIRILPMPVANYKIDGKDLFTESQMQSYAFECQEAAKAQKNNAFVDPCSVYLSKPNAPSPQRDDTPAKAVEWQGLTDDELHALHYELKCAAFGATSTLGMYRILEAKLKEKNGC